MYLFDTRSALVAIVVSTLFTHSTGTPWPPFLNRNSRRPAGGDQDPKWMLDSEWEGPHNQPPILSPEPIRDRALAIYLAKKAKWWLDDLLSPYPDGRHSFAKALREHNNVHTVFLKDHYHYERDKPREEIMVRLLSGDGGNGGPNFPTHLKTTDPYFDVPRLLYDTLSTGMARKPFARWEIQLVTGEAYRIEYASYYNLERPTPLHLGSSSERHSGNHMADVPSQEVDDDNESISKNRPVMGEEEQTSRRSLAGNDQDMVDDFGGPDRDIDDDEKQPESRGLKRVRPWEEIEDEELAKEHRPGTPE
ncbi:MAG: hypothetical protein M1837_004368 [Sclerophora amabilis]|nr:MAG: hypothetical protein M1837_004368 [Sclerophora amabilis]